MTNRTATALLLAIGLLPALGGAAPRPVEAGAPLPVKPTGPIALEHRLSAQPSVGVPLELTITARVEADVADVGIEANASAPSSVLVTAPSLVAAGEDFYSWTMTIVPLDAEASYLTVIVAGNVAGLAQARSLTVSLRSSGARDAAPAVAAGEDLFIELPVEEGP